MRVPYLRALRYARRWVTGAPDVVRTEVILPSDDAPIEASVYHPPTVDQGFGRHPGWILMHGITRPGRFHDSLIRFASSMAASGAVVIVPEVPEWARLELAPRKTLPAIEAARRYLQEHSAVEGKLGLAGFSFGSPQVIRAALNPELSKHLGVVAAFGGYAELESAMRFQFTGDHELDGRVTRLRPDPYGRWIVAANYLTHVPGYEGAGEVAEALRALAANAGDLQVDSWDPAMDPAKAVIRASLEPADRELFDHFAPETNAEPIPGSERVDRWVEELAQAARTKDPELELPIGEIRSSVPIHIIHGTEDHLIPVSEGHRLARRLAGSPVSLTVTSLFAHSTVGSQARGWRENVQENLRFVRALERILRSV